LPVVRLEFARFAKMVGASRKEILDRLPYIGLDIESADNRSVRVEYSPNRPDLGTDFGIARALKGLLGTETGPPEFRTKPTGMTVTVDPRLSNVRPYIACCVATGLDLDDEDVRQIISLQEDLHNGLGRKRRTAAVGLHDFDMVSSPLSYRGVPSTFEFVPLGGDRPSSIHSILSDTYEGKTYGHILGDSDVFPVITDSRGTVLSFPPIINGDATRVTTKTKRILIDVTSTSQKTGDDVLAILATTISEAGAKMGTVAVKYPDKTRATPDLSPTTLPLDFELVKSVIGLDLPRREMIACLARSRIGVRGNYAVGPRYRVDLLHPVDIAEEVALGYGIDRIKPIYPPSKTPGGFNPFEEFLDSVSTVMAGEGMIETMTYELTDRRTLYDHFKRPSSKKVTVQNPKSLDHSILRDTLLPSLMDVLSRNVKSDYPQRVFEIGRTYTRTHDGVKESWHLGCLVAHSQSTYTEGKMYLEAVLRVVAGLEATTRATEHWAFSAGRCASITVKDEMLGYIGELKPDTISAFRVGVPVSGFEIDLSKLYELLKQSGPPSGADGLRSKAH
jgi:phenylalanyl-tRNA synthetase beta chain